MFWNLWLLLLLLLLLHFSYSSASLSDQDQLSSCVTLLLKRRKRGGKEEEKRRKRGGKEEERRRKEEEKGSKISKFSRLTRRQLFTAHRHGGYRWSRGGFFSAQAAGAQVPHQSFYPGYATAQYTGWPP